MEKAPGFREEARGLDRHPAANVEPLPRRRVDDE